MISLPTYYYQFPACHGFAVGDGGQAPPQLIMTLLFILKNKKKVKIIKPTQKNKRGAGYDQRPLETNLITDRLLTTVNH